MYGLFIKNKNVTTKGLSIEGCISVHEHYQDAIAGTMHTKKKRIRLFCIIAAKSFARYKPELAIRIRKYFKPKG